MTNVRIGVQHNSAKPGVAEVFNVFDTASDLVHLGSALLADGRWEGQYSTPAFKLTIHSESLPHLLVAFHHLRCADHAIRCCDWNGEPR